MKAIWAITQEDVKEEPELRYVGMLHAAQVQPWSCHMMECALSYHALRRCRILKELSVAERVSR